MQARPKTSETDLLVLCSRKSPHPDHTAGLKRQLSKELDWDYIVEEGTRHGVLSLLYYNLHTQKCLTALPGNSQKILQISARNNAGRSMSLVGELVRILRMFESEGIDAMPFKGPIVGLAAYGDYFVRTFGDLDILVHKESLGRARALFAEAGYKPLLPLTKNQERTYFDTECALPLQNAHGFVIELHWRFNETHASVNFPMEEVWAR